MIKIKKFFQKLKRVKNLELTCKWYDGETFSILVVDVLSVGSYGFITIFQIQVFKIIFSLTIPEEGAPVL